MRKIHVLYQNIAVLGTVSQKTRCSCGAKLTKPVTRIYFKKLIGDVNTTYAN